jgi:hypothetical protein
MLFFASLEALSVAIDDQSLSSISIGSSSNFDRPISTSSTCFQPRIRLLFKVFGFGFSKSDMSTSENSTHWLASPPWSWVSPLPVANMWVALHFMWCLPLPPAALIGLMWWFPASQYPLSALHCVHAAPLRQAICRYCYFVLFYSVSFLCVVAFHLTQIGWSADSLSMLEISFSLFFSSLVCSVSLETSLDLSL